MKSEQLLKNIVLKKLKSAIEIWRQEKALDTEASLQVRLEYSRDEKFGDYSSPFALENKVHFPGNPFDLAKSLLPYLQIDSDFSDVTATPPGFINFRVRPALLAHYVKDHLHSRVDFSQELEPRKICLEYVSANPTGPLNIVSARSAAYGSALSALLKTLGHNVHTEFYVNDYGNQVYLLGVAVLLRYLEWKGQPLLFQESEDGRTVEQLILQNTLPLESYRGEYLIPIAYKVAENPDLVAEIESVYSEKKLGTQLQVLIHKLSRLAIETNVTKQKQDLETFGVKFDDFFFESSLHNSNQVASITNHLKEKDLKIEDGKTFFLSTIYGDDKDRVILREDGRPTYLMADIAYHKDKYNRGFAELIDIWGPDHYGYIARLSGAIQSLGFAKESFRVLIAQQVNLIENKQKVKMSKRLGVFQTMEDLLRYLGDSAKDVARYFFLMRSSDAPLDFDLDLAKDESEKNPVFYIQYAHARVCSIFRELGIVSESDWQIDVNVLSASEDRLRLLFWISRFQEEVYDAAKTLEPHRLTNYLQSLSKAFTKFYGNKENRIKEKTGIERLTLLSLISLVQISLSSGLSILGISSPEKMGKSL